ncbi:MAG: hypothetical protein IKP31_04345 [Lachnospiraceae bacterium]|nr:hypothetical protein [Lachnospiraceae bacterium]
MKVFRKILYVLAGLLVLLTVFIVVCAYNPGLTKKLQSVIFRGKIVEVSNVTDKAASKDAADDTAVSENTVSREEYRMRSLEELGVPEDALITDIDSYYKDCHDQIVERGIGEYAFENFIATEVLVQDIYSKYSNKEYVDGYMNSTLNEIGASAYDMNLLVEELTGKHYRLTHQLVISAGN